MPSIYDENLTKIRELQEFCQWPAQQWMKECFDLNLPFHVTEAFRSQRRQDELYAQGRTRPGKVVTWTRHSTHTQRIAMDLYPVSNLPALQERAFYVHLDEIGQKYGIYRPKETLAFGDWGHWQFEKAHPYTPQLSLDQQKKKFSDQIKGLSGNIRGRAIARYVNIYGEQPML